MAIDFTKPATTDNYSTQFVPNIQANQTALAQWLDSTAVTITGTPPTEAKRYNATSGLFERYTGSVWATLGVGYVAKAGDTMTGNLGITKATPVFTLNDTGSANSSQIVFAQAGAGKGYIGVPSVSGGLIAGAAVGDLAIRSEGGVIRFSPDSGATTALSVSSSAVTSTRPFNAAVGGAQVFQFMRLTNAGVGGEIITNGAYSTYIRFGYNNGSNIQGFVGGADILVIGASAANFAVRAENALIFSIGGAAQVAYAALLSGGFAVGGSAMVVTSFSTTNRAVLGIEGNGSTGSALLGFGNTSAYKSYIFDDGAASSTFRINAANSGGRIILGTNAVDQFFFTPNGNLLIGRSTDLGSLFYLQVGSIGAANRSAILGSDQYSLGLWGAGNAPVYLGANTSSTPDFIVSNASAAEIFRVKYAGGTFGHDGSSGLYELGFRSLIVRTPANASALTIDQRGAMVVGSFSSLTVNTGVFARGDMVTFYQDGASGFTLTQGSGFTLRLGGTATTGSRTILGRGTATLLFNSGTEAVLVGNCT